MPTSSGAVTIQWGGMRLLFPTRRSRDHPGSRLHRQSKTCQYARPLEVVTGLLYLSPDSTDVHDQNETVAPPLFNLPHDQLCPGNDALQKLMGS